MLHRHLSSANLARRDFMRIVAAGAGRLSAIAAASALLADKHADAMGLFPRDDDHRHHDDVTHLTMTMTITVSDGAHSFEQTTVKCRLKIC